MKVGERAGAICGRNRETGKLEVFGYGAYEGDLVPDVPEDSRGMARAMQEAGVTNPCILLDSGERVYGCECWWGPEAVIRKRLAGRDDLVMVSPVAARTALDGADRGE